jgi:CheY-like chemotaxis protein/Tfp pilus assembly protein PilZ
MGLKLTYVDRSRLWADLLNVEGDRVFVPADELPGVGEIVSIVVEAPELAAPLLVSGTVQGQRPATGKFPAGVFVHIDAPSVELCRVALETPRDGMVRTAGRKELRADCTLTGRIVGPRPSGDCVVKSLSPTGFTLKGAATLTDELKVDVLLTLPDGYEAAVAAQVIWVRPELQLAGFKITSVDAKGEAKIAETVRGLATVPQVSTGVTIVVADDDRSILDFAFRAISKSGHRVLRAERGDTALALIRQERPRLVFLDVLMPGLDGLEVCKAMRSDEHLTRIPVVLLSAMGEVRLKEAARQSGANDFLTKPMHLEALRTLVDKYVG